MLISPSCRHYADDAMPRPQMLMPLLLFFHVCRHDIFCFSPFRDAMPLPVSRAMPDATPLWQDDTLMPRCAPRHAAAMLPPLRYAACYAMLLPKR